ncbi:hypothetical protein HUJ04_013171 [Dendroctonus ponderosae]|nr:hypothetical protein HUJ04_013171 [Dendroctonus ponderosae]
MWVSIMSDPGVHPENVPSIKKELDSFAECSPSNSNLYSPTTTTTIISENVIQSSDRIDYGEHYDGKMRSPDSPDRQYCSSTTQPHTDPGIGHSECTHMVERLESLSILKEEYYLLKALVLTNSDVRLDEYQSLRNFRDSILTSLTDAIGILRPNTMLQQIQQLLLCLPALRQADQVVRRFWSDIHTQNLVPMNKLFLEMLEASNR